MIYEIVWFQLLQLVIGSSAVSLAVLLGTYMGGMCLGSLALPRLVPRRMHPLRVYAWLELTLGVLGIAVLFVMPYVTDLYTLAAGTGLPAVLGRGIVCVACLLPPTMLMGATLPAIARWMEESPEGISWLGFFYGGNIAGAVLGCLAAGFYLLRVHDMEKATYVAAMLNVSIGLFALALAVFIPNAQPQAIAPDRDAIVPRRPWLVYATIALSGACALAAEVVWTRQLALMLGGTVYTFSNILAVFLVGLGIGSSVGSMIARSSPRPRLLLGLCQLLAAGGIAWTASMLSRSVPFWPINPYLSKDPWLTFQLDLARCFWSILPATILWGASFPLALAAGAAKGQDPGRLVGSMYAANTVGAILGAVGASLFLVYWLGTQRAEEILIGLSVAAALFTIVPYAWSLGWSPALNRSSLALGGVSVVVALALIAWPAAKLVQSVPPLPWELVAFGRTLATSLEEKRTNLYMGEGLNSSVAVTESGSTRYFHISGKVEASNNDQDMRLERMLGHLPALFHPNPRSVLVVGCGAGVTAGSFLTYPSVERVVICELEPLVPQAIAPYFANENYSVATDPRVQIIFDDARHYILTSKEQFDIITSDPIHPWVKGSATLYTKEYFELCKRRLNPGGLITQWVPLYESNEAVVKSEMATFFDVFPHGTIWNNDDSGKGYDTVLLGQAEPLKINADELQQRLERPDHHSAAKSLEDVGFKTLVGLLTKYGGQASDLRPWLEDAEINRDRNLRLQYLAGLELNNNEGEAIADKMLSYRRFPDNLMVGSGWRAHALQVALEQAIGSQQKRKPASKPEG